jgi:hypothetical protein
MTWANEFLRVLARSPESIKDMVRDFSAAEIEETNDIAFWMWRNCDHRRSRVENIQNIVLDAITVVARPVSMSMPRRHTIH